MGRPKGSKNKPKVITPEMSFAATLAQQEEIVRNCSAIVEEKTEVLAQAKEELIVAKKELKKAEKELAALQEKKAIADAENAVKEQRAAVDVVIDDLIKQGMTSEQIIAVLKPA